MERERLAQLHSRALDARAREHAAAGDWRQVIAAGRAALVHDSLQEPIYRVLMEAHARLGERGEALRQYDLLRAVLARELGVAPLPETEALRVAILGGAFDRSAPVEPADEARRAPAAALACRPGVAAPRFVGRKAELAALDAELGSSGRGRRACRPPHRRCGPRQVAAVAGVVRGVARRMRRIGGASAWRRPKPCPLRRLSNCSAAMPAPSASSGPAHRWPACGWRRWPACSRRCGTSLPGSAGSRRPATR